MRVLKSRVQGVKNYSRFMVYASDFRFKVWVVSEGLEFEVKGVGFKVWV